MFIGIVLLFCFTTVSSTNARVKNSNWSVIHNNTSYSSLRVNASSISLSTSSSVSIPAALKSIGYILIEVKPGNVLISLKITLFVFSSRKKSTLERPLPSSTLNISIAFFLISSAFSFEILAGITS